MVLTDGEIGARRGGWGGWLLAGLALTVLACTSPREEPEDPEGPAPGAEAGSGSGLDSAPAGPADAAAGVATDGAAGARLDTAGAQIDAGTAGPADGPAVPPPPDASAPPPDAMVGPPSCQAGTHVCGNQCKSDSDPETCGSSCSRCPATDNGDAVCSPQRTCDIACRSGAALCADPGGMLKSCGITSWDFEMGVNGWEVSTTEDQAVGNVLAIAEGRARSGTHALRGTLDVRSGKTQILVTYRLCSPGTSMDRRGKTLHVDTFIEGAPAGTTHRCAIAAYGGQSEFIGPTLGGDRPLIARTGQWSHLEYKIVEPIAASAYYLYLTCLLSFDGTPWTGTVTLDDIGID